MREIQRQLSRDIRAETDAFALFRCGTRTTEAAN